MLRSVTGIASVPASAAGERCVLAASWVITSDDGGELRNFSSSDW